MVAPSGWRFQECTKKRVTLIRTEKSGEWELKRTEIPSNWYATGILVKDNYGEEEWRIVTSQPTIRLGQIYRDVFPTPGSPTITSEFGHHYGKFADKVETARELVCLAKMVNEYNAILGSFYTSEARDGAVKEAKKVLNKCRRDHGIQISSIRTYPFGF